MKVLGTRSDELTVNFVVWFCLAMQVCTAGYPLNDARSASGYRPLFPLRLRRKKVVPLQLLTRGYAMRPWLGGCEGRDSKRGHNGHAGSNRQFRVASESFV